MILSSRTGSGRISMEREMAFWRGGAPLSKPETERFKGLLEAKAGEIGISDLDREVASNAIEAKFSLIPRSSCADRLRSLRQGVDGLALQEGVDVYWTNQPVHTPVTHNEYFTTLVFPGMKDALVHANSLQIHFEVSEEDVVDAYKRMNSVAPWFMLASSLHGGGADRLELTAQSLGEMGELMLPQDFHTLSEYMPYVRAMSNLVETRIVDSGIYQQVLRDFPRMFDASGRVRLTPDKIFHQARIRPDLRLPNGNISLEFRAIDGMAQLDHEIVIAERAIGAFEGKSPDPGATLAGARSFLLSLLDPIARLPPKRSIDLSSSSPVAV